MALIATVPPGTIARRAATTTDPTGARERLGLPTDLPVLLAVLSSFRDRALPGDLATFGEVGLAGEEQAAAAYQYRYALAEAWGETTAAIMALMPTIGKPAAYNVTVSNGPGAGPPPARPKSITTGSP